MVQVKYSCKCIYPKKLCSCNKIKIKLLLSNFQCVFSTQLMGFNLSIHCTYIWCDNKNKGCHGSLMRQLFIYNGLLQIL